MEKSFLESGFPIFGGKFYVASLNLGFWPPFCTCIFDFRLFLLNFSSFELLYQSCAFQCKIHSKNYFSEVGSLEPPLSTNGSSKYLDHKTIKTT